MARKLKGGAIQSNTITITQIQTTAVTNIVTQSGPRVSSLIYPGNDTAGNTVGGQTVYINGSGFETNNAIYINSNAVPSKSFISASNLSFTTPALAAGIYPVYVINTDSGATAIFIPGYISSAEPTWVTSAGSLAGSQDELTAWSYSLSTTGDAPITYALAAGSSLPSGISLAANGVISGTLSSPSGNATTYTFSVTATDAQNQDATRQFTVTTSTGEGVLFANNVLLIHADGTNNKNNHTFLDSSNNNFTITRNGNATQGSFSPFSQTGWSGYFDGTGDYLSAANNAALQMSGDFTWEAWVYPISNSSAGNYKTLWAQRATADGFGGPAVVIDSSGNCLLFISNAAGSAWSVSGFNTGVTTSLNSWQHIALVKNGTTLTLYKNGVAGTSTTHSTAVGTSGSLSLMAGAADGSQAVDGYMSNFRIVKGTAVYTASFTPPTSPSTNIANTSLLTLQSNRFIDNSNNNFTITRNGDTSIQAFSPFAPTVAYSTANVGGSGYFDGSGDYLTLPSNAAYAYSTSAFTIEAWVYLTGDYSIARTILGREAGDFNLYITSTNGYLSVWTGSAQASTTAIQRNTWVHVAVVREGTGTNQTKLYVNGTAVHSFTNTTNFSATINYIGLNVGAGSDYWLGYISNLRVVKGTAVYTSAFTPPTAPLTNIANTSLLCNFTNAGIFDQTAKNIIETVGDAKVSTAQYKYGTGSMAFDGTGDYLSMPATATNRINTTGNFTIEFWAYFNTVASNQRLIAWDNSTNNFVIAIYTSSDGVLSYYLSSNGTTWNIALQSLMGNISATTWTHVALVRNGSVFTPYINGVAGSTTTSAATLTTSTLPLIIGASGNGIGPFNGYIDDFRITKGYARYTSTFTPPTSALKDS